MNVTRIITLWLTGALFAGSAAVAQKLPAPPRVLGTSPEARVLVPARDTATVQARVVRPDLALLEALAGGHRTTGEPARFVIDLFPGLDLEAEVTAGETRPGGGTTLFARLTEVELGSAQFTIESGVLTASIDFPAGNYTVERQADGTYQVTRKAGQLFAPERPPREAFGRSSEAPSFSDPSAPEPDVPVDSGRLIDILIVWTPAAEAAAGGLAAMQSLAQASVDNANLTYLNSGVAHRLRLVHREQLPYSERTSCGSDAFDCALDDLTFNGDGYMDAVHALRNTHGADLVALLISDSAFCGIAWLTSSVTTAFSVTAWNCAVGNKSFVHEVGHNMGAHHDPYVAPGPGAHAYSHGLVNLTSRWRTVMSYNNHCTATAPGTSCTRIQYLSNPRLTYGGAPLGDATVRNNAHTLNRTSKAMAAFRPTSALHPVPQRFADVPTFYPLYGHVEFFAQAGITGGCTVAVPPALPGYCPDAPVTRRQMAVFIERALRAPNWTPPAATGLFTDVPAGTQFAAYVEALRSDGITSGCTATEYCPESSVTRGQMAAFVLRARCGAAYLPNLPAVPTFADVPTNYPFYGHIEKLNALGITGGCATGPARYCPADPVTRAQMAAFIERAYPFVSGLAPSEACTP